MKLMSLCALALAIPAVLVAQSPTVHDSAGITIVDNIAPLWTRDAPEHLGATPILSLGSATGAPEEQFGVVQDAVRLGNGDVVVADRKNYELRVFGRDGQFVRRIGRRGDGPGDLQGIWSIYRLPGDVILVWDIRSHRLTWYTSDGKVRRTLNVDHPPSSDPHTTFDLFAVGPVGDEFLGFRGPFRFNPPAGIYHDSLTIYRVDAAGHVHPTAALRRGDSWEFKQDGDIDFDDMPFTTQSSMATTRAGVWYTDGVNFELRFYAPDGHLRRIVRERRALAPVVASDAEGYRKAQIDQVKTEKLRNESTRGALVSSVEAAMKWLVMPTHKAAFASIKVDPSGDVWAGEFGDSTAVQRWDHFDRSGRLLGVMTVPAGVDVLEIGRDYLLGRVRDADDVEGVRVYSITPRPAGE
jgi:hypothetical protein